MGENVARQHALVNPIRMKVILLPFAVKSVSLVNFRSMAVEKVAILSLGFSAYKRKQHKTNRNVKKKKAK